VNGGASPRWSGDGDEVFYVGPDDRLMAAAVDQELPDANVAAPRALFQLRTRFDRGYPYDVPADGQRVLVNVGRDAAGDTSR
jgi:hypothetical protein